MDRQHGRERAHVISAVPLEAGQRDRLAGYLGGLVGKEIELTAAVDESILAGLVAQGGGQAHRRQRQDQAPGLEEIFG